MAVARSALERAVLRHLGYRKRLNFRDRSGRVARALAVICMQAAQKAVEPGNMRLPHQTKILKAMDLGQVAVEERKDEPRLAAGLAVPLTILPPFAFERSRNTGNGVCRSDGRGFTRGPCIRRRNILWQHIL